MKLLCLDLSTTCSGWAFYVGDKLKASGAIKPQVKGISKLRYPDAAYARIVDISDKIKNLVAEHEPDKILIEEVNRGINRIAQKSLDALHFFIIDRLMLLDSNLISKIAYIDSNGKRGWRPTLGLKLDDQDKEYNKQARDYNKKYAKDIKKGEKSLKDIIDWKHLSIRHVNKRLKLKLDINNVGDADIADAICLGLAFLKI